jgi:transposase
VEDICDALGVSKASCYRWRRIFDKLGTVNKPPSPLKGPTRIITRALLTAIENLFIEDSDIFLDEICTWLAFEHRITISTSALSRNLTQAGLTRKILRKLACERDEVRVSDYKDS